MAVPKVLAMHYLKRTQQKNPAVLGKNVIQDSAKSLEARGDAALMKNLLKPENEVRITDITSDGDSAPERLVNELEWEEGDGVHQNLIGQKVFKNKPKLHRG